jgi:formylmethanofuran dehydrogenase subunit E
MSVKIRSYAFEEFVERVRTFHGYAAPGVIIGGFMVDLAYKHLPADGFSDALCETPKCLPDAVQLLTPCTTGNGWLTVINVGRYAVTFYDKKTGEGIRVFVDATKVGSWVEINNWYFKLKAKKEQDEELLMEQIREAGARICSIQHVKVANRFLGTRHRGGFGVCSQCREAYPLADGPVCLDCQGEGLYARASAAEQSRKTAPTHAR